ncbi:hypothetical protein EVAR_9246_1 [Eumeta japonica]|uniref:Uncharacterized protein n=1 Tax=Eumeta variegata TaxID=151549 RepID=A0A4C1TLJ6_EUMVA|nr:hypothetical protein EVAR_9246_1 [Eumeta japonica]
MYNDLCQSRPRRTKIYRIRIKSARKFDFSECRQVIAVGGGTYPLTQLKFEDHLTHKNEIPLLIFPSRSTEARKFVLFEETRNQESVALFVQGDPSISVAGGREGRRALCLFKQ